MVEETSIQAILDDVEGLMGDLPESSQPSIRAVGLLERMAAKLSRVAGLSEAQAKLVNRSTLRAGTMVTLRLAAEGADEREAVAVAYAVWSGQVAQLGMCIPNVSTPGLSPLCKGDASAWEKLLKDYDALVSERLLQEERQEDGLAVLRRLKSELDVSFDYLGSILDVNGETVRRWILARIPIPSERLATISKAGSTYGRIRSHFRPARIAMVVRRPADIFDGDNALNWILRGRMEDVADRYEEHLRFQA